MSNLFSAGTTAETRVNKRNANLIRFYDSSIRKLKKLILNIDIQRFEKTYIETIKALNLRKALKNKLALCRG